MCAVDSIDKKHHSIQILRKTYIWNQKIFFRMLMMALLSDHKLYKEEEEENLNPCTLSMSTFLIGNKCITFESRLKEDVCHLCQAYWNEFVFTNGRQKIKSTVHVLPTKVGLHMSRNVLPHV